MDPTPEVLALGDLPGIEVTGTVPDVRPYYEQAFAAVVPLLFGTGTRLKILEAMAAGVPVISTRLGAEGLDVTGGENILMPQAEQEWLPAIECLHESDGRWKELADGGRRLVCAKYDWEMIGRRLAGLYAGWVAPVRAAEAEHAI
jgi:glycosyltransferase involved in cell wall biosynthesis